MQALVEFLGSACQNALHLLPLEIEERQSLSYSEITEGWSPTFFFFPFMKSQMGE